MSLYLGKLGRDIVRYTVNHPRLDRAVDRFSNVAHKLLGDRYAPDLTRGVTHGYYKALEVIKMDPSFQWLIPNPIGETVSKPVYISFDSVTPERLVKLYRATRSAEKAFSPFRQKVSDPREYFQCALAIFSGGQIQVQELIAVNRSLADYARRFGDPSEYFWHVIIRFMDKLRAGSISSWDAAAKSIIRDYDRKFSDQQNSRLLYLMPALHALIEAAHSPEDLKMAGSRIRQFMRQCNSDEKVYGYIQNELVKLIRPQSQNDTASFSG